MLPQGTQSLSEEEVALMLRHRAVQAEETRMEGREALAAGEELLEGIMGGR